MKNIHSMSIEEINKKAAVKVNTEMLKFYWSLGEDICEKQKQDKGGAVGF